MIERKTKFEPRILGGVYGEDRKGMFDFIDYLIDSINWGYAFICLIKLAACIGFAWWSIYTILEFAAGR